MGTTQAVIECKLPANENSSINKILCASAKAYITNTEVVEGEVNFGGFANFLVVYESEEEGVQSLEYSAEFKDRFKNEGLPSGSVAVVGATVVDVNTTSISGTNDIKVVAVVEISVDAITTAQTNVLTGAPGFFSQNEIVEFTAHNQTVNDRFEVMQDVEIRDSVAKILNVSTTAFLDSTTVGAGLLTLRGGLSVDICYLTNAEAPELRGTQTLVDWTQEVLASEVTADSYIQSVLNLLYSDVKVTTNLSEDSSVVNIEIPMQYLGYVFNARQVDAVTDIFSPEYELKMTTQSVPTIVPLPSAVFTEKINGNLVIAENAPFIDEVLGNCCNWVVLANSGVQNNELLVEGIAYTTVIYLNKELGANYSIEVEIPFSVAKDVGQVPANAAPLVNISLGEVSAKSKRGSEIEVTAHLYISADFYAEETQAVITQLEQGDEKPQTDCVLSIYIAKPNDTLWDIAKELNVSPDMILEQNPTLEMPTKGGERIIIYRQREVLF